jgi:DNA-binding ferritin-like protein
MERIMPKGLIDYPDYWHARAEEARVVAESTQDSTSREMMLRIVSDYERMAQTAEKRVNRKLRQDTTSSRLAH